MVVPVYLTIPSEALLFKKYNKKVAVIISLVVARKRPVNLMIDAPTEKNLIDEKVLSHD